MERYLDQRIINTKQDLYTALFSILKTSIKAQAIKICKEANITTRTFYNHYKGSHCVESLTQDAINDQLSLRLPIPVKLKPQNTKQLIIYLLRFLVEFCSTNKELINGTLKYSMKHGFKNTYIDLLIKTINYNINHELQLICSDQQNITINIWSEFITWGFIGLFFNRTIEGRSIDYDVIKNNIFQFIKNINL